MRIVFFDTETTGLSESDRLCSIAIKERNVVEPILDALYCPPVRIPYTASAIHNITNEMVAERPAFMESEDYGKVKSLLEHSQVVAVAHNAAFDKSMIGREDIRPANVVCTFKVARALDPRQYLGGYSLQYLREALSLNVDGRAHSAIGDVLVLEALFDRLIAKLAADHGSEEAALSEMIRISSEPVLFTTFRFGKHKGRKIEEVLVDDRGYLEWLLKSKKQKPENELDWIYTLEQYLAKSI